MYVVCLFFVTRLAVFTQQHVHIQIVAFYHQLRSVSHMYKMLLCIH